MHVRTTAKRTTWLYLVALPWVASAAAETAQQYPHQAGSQQDAGGSSGACPMPTDKPAPERQQQSSLADQVNDVFRGLSKEGADKFDAAVTPAKGWHVGILALTHHCCRDILQHDYAQDGQDAEAAGLAKKCRKVSSLAPLAGAYTINSQGVVCGPRMHAPLLEYAVNMATGVKYVVKRIESVYGHRSSAIIGTPVLLLKQLFFPSTRDEQCLSLISQLGAAGRAALAEDAWHMGTRRWPPVLVEAVLTHLNAAVGLMGLHEDFTQPASRKTCRDIDAWYDERWQLTKVGKACRAMVDQDDAVLLQNINTETVLAGLNSQLLKHSLASFGRAGRAGV